MQDQSRLTDDELECVRRIRAKSYVEPLGNYCQFDLVATPSPTFTEMQSGEARRMRDRLRVLQDELPGPAELGLLEHVGRYEPSCRWNIYRVLPTLWDVELDG